MGFLDKIFGSKKNSIAPSEKQVEHAVIVEFSYGIEGMDALYQLRDKLEGIIERDQLGEYDGHEMAVDYSHGFIYMYGPNAEVLFEGIRKTLEETEFLREAKVKLRFGPPGDEVKEMTIG